MNNPVSLLESKMLAVINEIESILIEDDIPTVTNPKTGKKIKATSALKANHPARDIATRVLQGKKMSAGQRRHLRKIGTSALSRTRPKKGPAKMSKSEKSPAQARYKLNKGEERKGAKSDTAYSTYGPDY